MGPNLIENTWAVYQFLSKMQKNATVTELFEWLFTGDVAEWLKAAVSKTAVRETVP